jgi:AcrR family transcriptional regulator
MLPLKKTDRRTLYTIQSIKDAFLHLLQEKPYKKITVAELCREADLTRSTFYLHFDNLSDVLNAVLDEALQFSKQPSFSLRPTSASFQDIMEDASLLPVCQRAAGQAKYQKLLMDPDLSEYIISRIASHSRAGVVSYIENRTHLSPKDSEMLFQYMIHGSFAINQRHHFLRTKEWYHDVELLSRFIQGGYEALSKAPSLP